MRKYLCVLIGLSLAVPATAADHPLRVRAPGVNINLGGIPGLRGNRASDFALRNRAFLEAARLRNGVHRSDFRLRNDHFVRDVRVRGLRHSFSAACSYCPVPVQASYVPIQQAVPIQTVTYQQPTYIEQPQVAYQQPQIQYAPPPVQYSYAYVPTYVPLLTSCYTLAAPVCYSTFAAPCHSTYGALRAYGGHCGSSFGRRFR